MIKNYLRIAFRNLMRHRSYSVINISGLAVGIAACLLIFVVVKWELGYDSFQKNYHQIYRIVSNGILQNGEETHNSGIPCPAYDALKNDFPQIKKIVPVSASSHAQITVLGNDPNSDLAISKKFIEERNMVFTYPEYFELFNTVWLAGEAASLKNPESIVLDRSSAEKYFGNWSKAMGQYLKIDNTLLVKVAGVVEDMPKNSDLPIPLFLSYEAFKKTGFQYNYSPEWGSLSSNHQIYVLLPENVSAASISAQFPAFIKKYYTNTGNDKKELVMQALKDIHFDARYGTYGDHSSNKSVLYTLALIGVLIIVMASINFINLSTAQSTGRSKEVGIRKVLGSSRNQLIGQVMGETFLIVLFSVVLSAGIAKLAMPYLSKVASVPDNLPLITGSSVLFLLITLVLVTVLSGLYPALIVSGFTPALALKNKINSASLGGISLRRVLVVTQFAISQILIIGTIVAVSQMNFVRNADLGFNKEALLVMPAYSDSANLSRMKPLKNELLQNPDVISVSFASDEVSSENDWGSNFAFDNKEEAAFPIFHKFGDEDYLKTYGLEIIAGRAYAPSDTMREIVVNESLLKKLGVKDIQSAVGKTLRIGGRQWLPIVGVVKDFKTNSLRDEIKPLTITTRDKFYFTLAVKIRTANISQTTARIQKAWEKAYPEYAFSSHFVDETIERFYVQETQLSLLYKIFAGIAIFISCLGLYGLVSFMAAQKTKEVGIRKVLGASVTNILFLFSKEFTILISVAFIIAAPIAWYLTNNWLQSFVFRINIGAGVFVLAIASSIIIAWITVGYKAMRAALVNPVKSLRSE